ncbi:MAG: hypothetical protein WAX80_00215 [Minisyncoccia bacterium]
MFKRLKEACSAVYDWFADDVYGDPDKVGVLYTKLDDTTEMLRMGNLEDWFRKSLEARLRRLQRRIDRCERKLGIA